MYSADSIPVRRGNQVILLRLWGTTTSWPAWVLPGGIAQEDLWVTFCPLKDEVLRHQEERGGEVNTLQNPQPLKKDNSALRK